MLLRGGWYMLYVGVVGGLLRTHYGAGLRHGCWLLAPYPEILKKVWLDWNGAFNFFFFNNEMFNSFFSSISSQNSFFSSFFSKRKPSLECHTTLVPRARPNTAVSCSNKAIGERWPQGGITWSKKSRVLPSVSVVTFVFTWIAFMTGFTLFLLMCNKTLLLWLV